MLFLSFWGIFFGRFRWFMFHNRFSHTLRRSFRLILLAICLFSDISTEMRTILFVIYPILEDNSKFGNITFGICLFSGVVIEIRTIIFATYLAQVFQAIMSKIMCKYVTSEMYFAF